MEIALQMASETHACRECGPRQTAMMRKLDDVNAFGPRLRIFPVCRAERTTNEHPCQKTVCGIALPPRLWTRPDPDDFRFTCKINWSACITELQKLPKDDPIQKWAGKMYRTYGSYPNWPEIGCGASFYPSMEGGSMVAEVQCENGTWETFITDPFPLQLADEIKQEQASEYLPKPQPGPDDGHKDIPFSPPMTHHLQDLPIIAKYPLEEWKRSHRPRLLVKGWYKLAMITSTRGMCNIQCCFEMARDEQGKSSSQRTESGPP